MSDLDGERVFFRVECYVCIFIDAVLIVAFVSSLGKTSEVYILANTSKVRLDKLCAPDVSVSSLANLISYGA